MAKLVAKWVAVCGLVMAPAMVLGAVGERRFQQLTVQGLAPEQRQAAGEALAMSGAGLQGLYNVMLRSPGLSERLLPLEDYVRAKTSVPHELNEFAILIQARLWTSQEEWKAHYPLALKAGLPESVAADLRVGRRPAGMPPDVAAAYDFCSELSTTHKMSDSTFAEAKRFFSDQQIVDLAAVSGTYATFAMLLATGNEGATDGSTPLPALGANGENPAAASSP